MNSDLSHFTRRELLKKSFVFSTGLLATGFLSRLGIAAQTDFSTNGIHLLALGDFGFGNDGQATVAKQMAAFAGKLGVPLTAVLGLGDNFYGTFTQDRFQKDFEEMYSQEALNCPFYQCIGNHDYEEITPSRRESVRSGPRKCEAQLEYARDHPNSRWKMPGHWYTVELPDAENPLVKIVIWDSNKGLGMLTPRQKLDQRRFMEEELAKPTRAPWLWLVGHAPMFTSSSNKRSSGKYVDDIKDLIRAHQVSFYISGHDHSLQHLEVEGFNTSFIVSGAGGGALTKVEPVANGFTQSVLGFNHIHVTPEWVDTQFIDGDGNRIHAFRRTVAGEVSILPVA